jgi:hypothetical protein
MGNKVEPHPALSMIEFLSILLELFKVEIVGKYTPLRGHASRAPTLFWYINLPEVACNRSRLRPVLSGYCLILIQMYVPI